MNTLLFVNATIGFSENLFLVCYATETIHFRIGYLTYFVMPLSLFILELGI